MLEHGSLAVAVVQRQVMIVEAAHAHGARDAWVDVYTYTPLGARVFLASPVPQARIAARDVLAVLPAEDAGAARRGGGGGGGDSGGAGAGMLELPPHAFSEYLELSTRAASRHEQLFRAAAAAAEKPQRARRWLVI
ncbi:uncharacterized protein BXZ73DRAFT_88613 [Epithele typhae]|uniref:uncharacterized protein n=1 Tax=Epithele typhae TaxID=378194 RepID=UPI0020088D2D|nr:uncharacterized protein BXZ73DRAFT_88613 [Epithele typhae]KAH9940946.1 hypothetical protein BXZ73DRAFT_88613 [Epithele typhae]